MGRGRALRRHWPIGVAVMAAAAVFVGVWFQPQKLWIDDRVSEPPPEAVSARADTTAAGTGTLSSEVASGRFVSREHHTAGVVRVIARADGRRTVRLEGLDTSNGPDLYVYLSANRADGPEGGFDDDYVSLGRLKGNQGDQNYEVPAGADVRRLGTVVIWCDRFNAVFGAADLTPT
jgi:hypothetical protein